MIPTVNSGICRGVRAYRVNPDRVDIERRCWTSSTRRHARAALTQIVIDGRERFELASGRRGEEINDRWTKIWSW